MLLLLCMTVAGNGFAEPRNGFAADNPGGSRLPRISASEAAARVQASEGGKILSVETVNSGNAYQVKVLNRRGQVRVFTVDANPPRRR
jgi:hypothetical protein